MGILAFGKTATRHDDRLRRLLLQELADTKIGPEVPEEGDWKLFPTDPIK